MSGTSLSATRRLAGVALLALAAAGCEEQHEPPVTAVPVRTEVLRRADFAPSITLLGVVRAGQTIPLAAAQRGTVVYARRFANGLETGAGVRKGELLAEVRNDQVLFARRQSQLQMEAADADFQRSKRSYELGVVSPAEYSSYRVRAQLAREAYNASTSDVGTLRIIAPATGRLVVTRLVPPGAVVESGTVLAEVASGGAAVVESSVAASDRDVLRPGLALRYTARGAWSGAGVIREVASAIDSAGTARVVAAVAPGERVPPPGSGVEMQVSLDRRPDSLTVPEDAIVAGPDGPAVFIAGGGGYEGRFRVKRVAIETGARANGRVEVRSGVRDGDRVIVAGADALSEESLVIEAETKP